MSKALRGVIIITLIEGVAFYVGLTIWFQALNAALRELGHHGMTITLGQTLLATLVWDVITGLEHYASVNLGNGRPLFGPLPPDK